MRNELEKQLENLNVELIRMGALCEKVIAGTTKALFNGDAKYTAKSHAVEEEIDKSEHQIEHICMSLLLFPFYLCSIENDLRSGTYR